MTVLRAFAGLIRYEWLMLLRSPVGGIGLVAALVWTATETSSDVGWPSINQSLYAFQLISATLLGVISFLLAAGSVARDLDGSRGELLFCRPVSMPMYVSAKFLGVFLFSFAIAGILCTFSLFRPCFSGRFHAYELRPFVLVMGLCVVPMLAYSCSLALALLTTLRKFVIALPVFLLYFFSVGVFRSSEPGVVSLADFSMRLYPRFLVTEVPIRLTDFSFQQLLDPVAPSLIGRAAIHLALSGVLLALSAWVLGQRHSYRAADRRRWITGSLQGLLGLGNRST